MVIDRTEASEFRGRAFFSRMEGEICDMVSRETRRCLKATVPGDFGLDLPQPPPKSVETRLDRVEGTTGYFVTTIRPKGYIKDTIVGSFTVDLDEVEVDFDEV